MNAKEGCTCSAALRGQQAMSALEHQILMLTRQSFEAWSSFAQTFLALIHGSQKLHMYQGQTSCWQIERQGDDSRHVPMHQHVLAGTTQDGIGAIEGKTQGHASILRHGEDLDGGCRVGKGPQGHIPTPCARHQHLLVGAVA